MNSLRLAGCSEQTIAAARGTKNVEPSQSIFQPEAEKVVGTFVVSLAVDGKQQVHTCVTYAYHGAFKSVCPTLSVYALGDTRQGTESRLRERVRKLGGSVGPTIRKAELRHCPPPANDYDEPEVDDAAPTERMIQAAEPVEIPFDLVIQPLKLVDVECIHCGAVATLARRADEDPADLECPVCLAIGGLVVKS